MDVCNTDTQMQFRHASTLNGPWTYMQRHWLTIPHYILVCAYCLGPTLQPQELFGLCSGLIPILGHVGGLPTGLVGCQDSALIPIQVLDNVERYLQLQRETDPVFTIAPGLESLTLTGDGAGQ